MYPFFYFLHQNSSMLGLIMQSRWWYVRLEYSLALFCAPWTSTSLAVAPSTAQYTVHRISFLYEYDTVRGTVQNRARKFSDTGTVMYCTGYMRYVPMSRAMMPYTYRTTIFQRVPCAFLSSNPISNRSSTIIRKSVASESTQQDEELCCYCFTEQTDPLDCVESFGVRFGHSR